MNTIGRNVPRLATLVLLSFMMVSLTSCISMIHRSVDRGDLSGVREEVSDGVSVEATDFRNKTPLQLAAEQGHMDIVEYLVEQADADINATTSEATGAVTPLRYAISNEDYLMVRYLLEHGADPSLPNSAGWRPIMTAARVGNREIIELLMEYGAEVNVRTEDGLTPIRIASNNGWTDIVVWLTLMIEDAEDGSGDGEQESAAPDDATG
ncbi:MAG: ankyrin repeat domain-containing protein [Spirochaeta sp.]|jgi:ankyrin repeat protein|nr:ankyrin repeat domain-containing protein [Spirochaeta sp.]